MLANPEQVASLAKSCTPDLHAMVERQQASAKKLCQAVVSLARLRPHQRDWAGYSSLPASRPTIWHEYPYPMTHPEALTPEEEMHVQDCPTCSPNYDALKRGD